MASGIHTKRVAIAGMNTGRRERGAACVGARLPFARVPDPGVVASGAMWRKWLWAAEKNPASRVRQGSLLRDVCLTTGFKPCCIASAPIEWGS